MSNTLAQTLTVYGTKQEEAVLASVLERLSQKARRLLHDARIRVYFLDDKQRYKDASRALQRLRVDVDGWPVAPNGLFVVEERTAYFRCHDPMTISHELLHGCDLALGDDVYFSGVSARWRNAFAQTQEFVTPYAASGLDEAFAEGARAQFGINSEKSPWPKVSAELLRTRSPEMAVIIEELLADPAA